MHMFSCMQTSWKRFENEEKRLDTRRGRVRHERHEADESVVAVEAELLAEAHEGLVGEERADLCGRALRADDDAARGELGVVAHGRCREAGAGAVVVEDGAVGVAVGVVRGPAEEPEALGRVHLEEHAVDGLVQEAGAVGEMHEAVLGRDVHVVHEADGGGHGGALLAAGVVGVEHAAHVEAERAGEARGDAVVVAQGGRAQPLRLLGVEELAAGDCAGVLPEAVELLVGVGEGARDDDEELVLDAVLGVRAHEGVVEADLAGELLGPLALVARVVRGVVELVGVVVRVGVVGYAGEAGDGVGVGAELGDDGVEALLVLVAGAEDAEDVLVEAVGDRGLHLVHDGAVEHVAGDREHAGGLGRGAREVVPPELHVLVHVVVRQQRERGVLRELEGRVARAALLLGERKRCVRGAAAGLHAAAGALVNTKNEGLEFSVAF
jgi:hypothetical protein